MIGGLFIGNFLGFVIGLFFTGFDFDILIGILENPFGKEGSKTIMLLIQGVIALVAFFVAPILFGSRWDLGNYQNLKTKKAVSPELIGLVILIMIAAMPFNAALLNWLSVENWPTALSELGKWVSNFDGNYDKITSFFVDFESAGDFLLAVLVMALLPAVGEELLFRGFFQPIFIQWTGKAHLGIILTAILFSAFHMQIAAFFPRFLLGLAMGYFFYWTGNIAYSMLAHFVNNFVTLLLAGLFKLGWSSIDVTEYAQVPVLYVLISMVGVGFLLYRIWQRRVSLEL